MKKRLSLRSRLIMLSASIMIPMVCLFLYAMSTLIGYGNAYDKVVKNITLVNSYTPSFRRDIDYTMYRVVIGSKSFASLEEEADKESSTYEQQHIRNPYQLIDKVQENFQELLETTGDKDQKDRIGWILKSLGKLESNIKIIEENVKTTGSYDENILILENGIYILTEDIRDDIQEYIFYEVQVMEQLREALDKQLGRSVVISVSLLGVIVAAGLVISGRITRSVTKPVKELCAAADMVAQGDFTSVTQIESDDEIQVLTTRFNHMKTEIGRLIENITIEQEHLRTMELRLLQSQVNPHFLYNTLDTIIWLAEGGQTKQIVSIITALSEFFRTVLSEGRDFITIREEESHIRSYLDIQQFRYQDILEYEIDLDEGIKKYEILKLTLQPLVENALYHGIKHKRGQGKITVTGYESEAGILLQVSDNGIGMDENELNLLREYVRGTQAIRKRGFGLANVNERIQKTYGSGYGLAFESKKNIGTTVTVSIPKRENHLAKNNLLFSKENKPAAENT